MNKTHDDEILFPNDIVSKTFIDDLLKLLCVCYENDMDTLILGITVKDQKLEVKITYSDADESEDEECEEVCGDVHETGDEKNK